MLVPTPEKRSGLEPGSVAGRWRSGGTGGKAFYRQAAETGFGAKGTQKRKKKKERKKERTGKKGTESRC
jgi:hypothetical protein